MDDLTLLRTEIDAIDQKIFDLLDERFSLSKKIKSVKEQQNINVSDPSREKTILDSIPHSKYHKEIEEIYLLIFHLSKVIQKKVG